ncbi:hypothetical protein ACSMX9_10580 [Streptomyces sp. LE64]|uniref:hypothetical protein n=1 Tax=Streptomyces sp. LE64 TaxID=3448653 RepID=UPI004041A9E8
MTHRTDRLDQLRSALDVLEGWPGSDHQHRKDMQALAGRVVPLVWAELREREVWHRMDAADRAALYWALTTGQRISTGWDPALSDWRPLVTELRRECAHFAVHCAAKHAQRWPEADGRADEHTEAVQALLWYRSLHPAWRPEVFRTLTHAHLTTEHDPDHHPPTTWDALHHVQQRALDEDKPRATNHRATGDANDVAELLDTLPDGWQTEAIRRMSTGHTPGHAVTTATEAINALPRFGVPLRPLPPP